MFKFLRSAIRQTWRSSFKMPTKHNMKFWNGLHSPYQRNFTTQPKSKEQLLEQHKIMMSKQFAQNINEGKKHIEKGHLQDAEESFLLALRISSMTDGDYNHGNGLASYYLGAIHQNQGDFEKAHDFYEKSVECFIHAASTKPKTTIQNPKNEPEIAKIQEKMNNSSEKLNEQYKRFELPDKDVNKLFDNIVKSVIEIEKANYYGLLSSYIRKDNFVEEFKKLPKMLEKPEENLKEIASLYFRMGDILLIERNLDCVDMKIKGLEYFEKLLKDNQQEMFNVYFEMGRFYKKLNFPKEAEIFYLKSLPFIEKLEPAFRDACLFNLHYKGLAQTYSQAGEYEKAMGSLKKAVELIDNSLKEKVSLKEKATIYHQASVMLMKMKDEKEAMALWEKSVKVFEDAGEIKLAGKMWLDNGMKYEKMRDVEGAKTAFEKSIELLQKAYGEEHEVTKIAKEKMEKLLKTDLKE